MNVTAWSDNVSLPEMDQWLIELRDGSTTKLQAAGGSETLSGEPATPLQSFHLTQVSLPGQTSTHAASTERAPIGDHLRRPMMWCEMPSCTSYHADPDALGEADARSRALRAGWRIDGLGRLACPRCLQTESFWTAHPVVAWDRNAALVMATLAAVRADLRGGGHTERGWHHEDAHPHQPQQLDSVPAQHRWHYDI